MLKFAEYLTEKNLGVEPNRGTLKAGGAGGEEHYAKYYSPEMRVKNNHQYTLANNHPASGLKAGDNVTLDDVQKIDGRYHGIFGNHKIRMDDLYKPLGGRVGKGQQKLEERQIDEIQNSIQDRVKANGGKPIRIRTGDGNIHEVAGIKKVEGFPKADAYLHDKNGDPVHWMSLKGPTFQQFAGTKGMLEHETMRDALSSLRRVRQNVHQDQPLPPSAAYHYDLNPDDPEHRKIIYQSMYGVDHGGAYGENNVNGIYSGETIGIKKSDHPDKDVFELDPEAVYNNKNDKTSDIADSKILVTHRKGLNQQGTGGRVMVVPKTFIPHSVSTDKALKPGYTHAGPRKRIKTISSMPAPIRAPSAVEVPTKKQHIVTTPLGKKVTTSIHPDDWHMTGADKAALIAKKTSNLKTPAPNLEQQRMTDDGGPAPKELYGNDGTHGGALFRGPTE